MVVADRPDAKNVAHRKQLTILGGPDLRVAKGPPIAFHPYRPMTFQIAFQGCGRKPG